jgi:hypothetical protein
VLDFVPDSDDPAALVGRFAEVLQPGSFLVISHATGEGAPGAAAQTQDLCQSATATAHTRTRSEIMRFFTGFDLVEPGLVSPPRWRPDSGAPEISERAWFSAGVGRRR